MAVCLAIAIHTMFVRHFRYTSICAKCRPMEPRGGNEPPHVHGVVHGRRFRSSTRHMPHRCYLHVGTQLSTQRQGLCVSRLDYHTPVPQHRSDRQPVSHTDAVFSRHCHSL